jgi:hypothetical protein
MEALVVEGQRAVENFQASGLADGVAEALRDLRVGCQRQRLPRQRGGANGKRISAGEMVVETLQRWCDNVVWVGEVHSQGGDVFAAAEKVLTDNYDYDRGEVLFKPTLACGPQTFRPTKGGALAYFVGGNDDFPINKGFKLKPWVKVCKEIFSFPGERRFHFQDPNGLEMAVWSDS